MDAQDIDIPIDNNAVANPVINAEPPKKRRKRDLHILAALPPRPKRAVNAYSMFLKEFFSRQNIGANRTTMVEASQQWRALTAAEKVEYKIACEEDKARYDTEIAIWKQQRASVKRPASAYALFLKETWEAEKANGTVGEKGVADMGRLATERWRQMAPADKEVYKTRYLDHVEQRKARLNEMGLSTSAVRARPPRAPTPRHPGQRVIIIHRPPQPELDEEDWQ